MKHRKIEQPLSSSFTSMEERDQISSLPEEVTDKIFLHLSMRDIAQTSRLSKQWKQYCDSFPYLQFDQNQSSGLVPYDQFKSSIDKKLITHQVKRSNILIFRLRMIPSEESPKDINRWISRVIERGVKEIDLHLRSKEKLYTVPQNLYVAETLTVLKLKGFKLSLCGKINLSQLKTLSLKRVELEKQSVMDHLLTSCCSSLEELRIVMCYNLNDLKISNLHQLKKVEIASYKLITSLAIQVPGLEKLFISELDAKYWGQLIEQRELPMNLEIDSRTCETIRELTICNTNMRSNALNSLISQCCNLESLVIDDCKHFYTIKISSQKLKNLVIRRCFRVLLAKIVAPNLTSFKCLTVGYPFNFVGICLKKYLLDHSNSDNYGWNHWLEEVMKIKMKFHKAKGQKLVIFPWCGYKRGEPFDAIVFEDSSSLEPHLLATVKSVNPRRLIITNITFTDLLNYMFNRKKCQCSRKLLAISSSESKIYEVIEKNPDYSIEYSSSVVLAKPEVNSYSPKKYWYPFSAESIGSHGCDSFYEALLVAGMTATLNATLLIVK